MTRASLVNLKYYHAEKVASPSENTSFSPGKNRRLDNKFCSARRVHSSTDKWDSIIYSMIVLSFWFLWMKLLLFLSHEWKVTHFRNNCKDWCTKVVQPPYFAMFFCESWMNHLLEISIPFFSVQRSEESGKISTLHSVETEAIHAKTLLRFRSRLEPRGPTDTALSFRWQAMFSLI